MEETAADLAELQELLDRSAAAAGEHLRSVIADESLALTVHGRASIIDVRAPEHADFRAICVANYGPAWDDWGAGAQYARINAHAMFTFRMLETET